MKPATFSYASLALVFALAVAACLAAPGKLNGEAPDTDEALESSLGPMDESAAVDPEFAALTADEPANSRASGEDDEPASLAPSQADADQAEEQRGADSNIADAKVQLSGPDMVAAAGHHYHNHHSVSGKMEMGAHTEKKGAFGWHAKFPVGGKGRR